MTFAQIPNTTPGGLGDWLVAAAAVVGIAVLVLTGLNQIKQLRAKPAKVARPASDRFVTRAEHERMEKDLTDKIAGGHKALMDQLSKHEEYTHRRLHELSGEVHNLGLKITAQPNETRVMIDTAVSPLTNKMDAASITLAAIAVKVGIGPVDGLAGAS